MAKTRLFLDIPYREKNTAKSLGAKWNPRAKKWYADIPPEQYIKFSKWILKNSDEALIAMKYIYIIEGERCCWKCGRPTRVIGLGLSGYIHMIGDDGEPPYEEIAPAGEELHLTWVDREEDIPPRLLHYIKETYSVRNGFSKTLNARTFANHCDHCGALQGNHFLFLEPDSPLSSFAHGEELIKRMKQLNIKAIPIKDNIQLDWEMGWCSNDFAYFEYGNVAELTLSDSYQESISYEELYSI